MHLSSCKPWNLTNKSTVIVLDDDVSITSTSMPGLESRRQGEDAHELQIFRVYYNSLWPRLPSCFVADIRKTAVIRKYSSWSADLCLILWLTVVTGSHVLCPVLSERLTAGTWGNVCQFAYGEDTIAWTHTTFLALLIHAVTMYESITSILQTLSIMTFCPGSQTAPGKPRLHSVPAPNFVLTLRYTVAAQTSYVPHHHNHHWTVCGSMSL